MMIHHPCISQCAIAMPVTNPAPARPTRCSEPIFEEKIEEPIWHPFASRPDRNESLPDSSFFRMEYQTVRIMPTAKAMMTTRSRPLNTVPFMVPVTDAVASAFVATSTLFVAANTLLVISFIVFLFFQSDYSALNL